MSISTPSTSGERAFADGEAFYADGVAFCDDHDLTSYSIFLRSQRTNMLERTGRWMRLWPWPVNS